MKIDFLNTFLTKKDSTFHIEDVDNLEKLNVLLDRVYELGGNLENKSLERVENAAKKAIEIFNHIFKNSTQKVIVLIYEFNEPNSFGAGNKFLHLQFSNTAKAERIKMLDFDIIIYETEIKNIKYETILRAIANTEMGFKPAIDQKIYFFDIENEKAFYMYDDRGCRTNG